MSAAASGPSVAPLASRLVGEASPAAARVVVCRAPSQGVGLLAAAWPSWLRSVASLRVCPALPGASGGFPERPLPCLGAGGSCTAATLARGPAPLLPAGDWRCYLKFYPVIVVQTI